MKKLAWIAVIALALAGTVQAQSNEELKAKLDQALKTIQDLQNRVQALEQQKAAPGHRYRQDQQFRRSDAGAVGVVPPRRRA